MKESEKSFKYLRMRKWNVYEVENSTQTVKWFRVIEDMTYCKMRICIVFSTQKSRV